MKCLGVLVLSVFAVGHRVVRIYRQLLLIQKCWCRNGCCTVPKGVPQASPYTCLTLFFCQGFRCEHRKICLLRSGYKNGPKGSCVDSLALTGGTIEKWLHHEVLSSLLSEAIDGFIAKWTVRRYSLVGESGALCLKGRSYPGSHSPLLSPVSTTPFPMTFPASHQGPSDHGLKPLKPLVKINLSFSKHTTVRKLEPGATFQPIMHPLACMIIWGAPLSWWLHELLLK